MFNESIHANSLIDVYERLKEHKINADSAHLPLLRSMQEHCRRFYHIRMEIAQSNLFSRFGNLLNHYLAVLPESPGLGIGCE